VDDAPYYSPSRWATTPESAERNPASPIERRWPSDRNDLRVHNGMVFRFAPESQISTIVDISSLTAFETSCFDEECRTASLLSQWMGFCRTFELP
jgi:hypothetical protein